MPLQDPESRCVPPATLREAFEAREEAAALRRLARQMAAVADTPALLRILSEAAMRQTHAQGAIVVDVGPRTGHVECAVGGLETTSGLSFPIAGSLSGRAIAERGPVLSTNFNDGTFPLAQQLRGLDLTQALCIPLPAHDAVLGVLLVARASGQPLFGPRDVQRLQVIGDYAGLALWKARLLDQAQSAHRAKNRFLATISHELLTPLTTLTGYGELLADQVIGPMSEQQLDIIGRILSVTHGLSGMIEEILAFASLEEGSDAVRPSELLAADLLQSVAVGLEPAAVHRGLALLWSAPPEPIRLVTDVDKARQVLMHVVNNAIKFTDHGEVALGVRCVGDEVHFTVRDTGIGIAPEDVERLFHPFTQLDQGLTRRHGGTGLGLHIANRLAVMLGGRLEVDSAPGRGSTFTLVLPGA